MRLTTSFEDLSCDGCGGAVDSDDDANGTTAFSDGTVCSLLLQSNYALLDYSILSINMLHCSKFQMLTKYL